MNSIKIKAKEKTKLTTGKTNLRFVVIDVGDVLGPYFSKLSFRRLEHKENKLGAHLLSSKSSFLHKKFYPTEDN